MTLNFSNSYNSNNIYLGFGIVFLSIVGDLFISSLKRKANIKDSGIFIPGHGGVFDRMDSIIGGILGYSLILYIDFGLN